MTQTADLAAAHIDNLLEECARRRLSLAATMERFLPAACRLMSASGVSVETQDETQEKRAYTWGTTRAPRLQIKRNLDVAGRSVGRAVFCYAAAPTKPRAELDATAGALCEQLDGVLFSIHTASLKQKLVEDMGRSLTRHVFGQAVDDAVVALHAATQCSRFALVYLDDEEGGAAHVRYRVYRGPKCVESSGGKPNPALERLLAARGERILEPGSLEIADALGLTGPVAASLVAGVAVPRPIGLAVVEAPNGLDTFARDLLQVFANAVTQRLVDYNRERRHLSQFFGPGVIDELVSVRDYAKHLSPRVETIGILYADINSFTKICERALKRPDRIGAFVDRWSTGAVDIVWKNGGVFDKMVGDCVIAHFGPPFYRSSPAERAEAAARTAFEIQEFTKRVQKEPEFAALAQKAGLPGLGVAIGINLCPAAVGLFGPNRDFSAFSRGMNETARLQGLAGFRETLAMDSLAAALKKSPAGRKYKTEGPREGAAKNVGKPLRYFLLK